jgi:hypothetical protein
MSKKRLKMNNCTIDAKTGVSTVTIHNEYGEFTGTAKCSPEDDFSRFQGCRLAELRARRKYAKRRLLIAKEKYKSVWNTCEEVYWGCHSESVFSVNPELNWSIYKITSKEIARASTEVSKWENEIIKLDDAICETQDIWEQGIKDLKRRKEEKKRA